MESKEDVQRPVGFFVEQLSHSGLWVAGYQRPADNPWSDHSYLARNSLTGKIDFYNNPFVSGVEQRFSTRFGAESLIREFKTRKGDEEKRVRFYVDVEAIIQPATDSVNSIIHQLNVQSLLTGLVLGSIVTALAITAVSKFF